MKPSRPLYLIELWVQGLLLHRRLMFGLLVHIWLQVSGIITEGETGMGRALCPWSGVTGPLAFGHGG